MSFFFFSFFQYHYHLSKNYVRLPWFASRISTSSRFLRAYVLFCIWSKISALISFIVNKKISKFKNQSFKILKCKKKILSVFFFIMPTTTPLSANVNFFFLSFSFFFFLFLFVFFFIFFQYQYHLSKNTSACHGLHHVYLLHHVFNIITYLTATIILHERQRVSTNN